MGTNQTSKCTSSNQSKLKHKYIGPFKIIRVINDNAYELKLPSTSKLHPVFNISRLRQFVPRLMPSVEQDDEPIPIPTMIDDQDEYKVQSIVNHKRVRGKMYYLVHWAGYNEYFNSWEPVEYLANARDIINQYHANIALKSVDDAVQDVTRTTQRLGRRLSRQINHIVRLHIISLNKCNNNQ